MTLDRAIILLLFNSFLKGIYQCSSDYFAGHSSASYYISFSTVFRNHLFYYSLSFFTFSVFMSDYFYIYKLMIFYTCFKSNFYQSCIIIPLINAISDLCDIDSLNFIKFSDTLFFAIPFTIKINSTAATRKTSNIILNILNTVFIIIFNCIP